MVPCTHVAPARTAAMAAAVASPKSSCPCQCSGTAEPSQPRPTDHRGRRFGVGHPDRVHDGNLPCAGLDRPREDNLQEARIRTGGVHREEAHLETVRHCVRDRSHDPRDEGVPIEAIGGELAIAHRGLDYRRMYADFADGVHIAL